MQYENKGRFIVKFKDIPSPRQHLFEIGVEERRNNYSEVELGFDEERALREAKRCLSCRRCLGCALCWAECKPEAIQFDMQDEIIELAADSVIISPGVERALDRIDRRFGLAKDTNVITDLQLERMLSESGPVRRAWSSAPTTVKSRQVSALSRHMTRRLPECTRRPSPWL